MVDKPNKDSKITTPSERSALVTATGVILSFLLLFAKEWMAYTDDGGWETKDWFFGLPFLISLLLLLGAVGTALLPYYQTVKQWKKPVILFILGVVCAFIAVLLSELT